MPKWMVEQAKGIEPSFPAWKAGVLAVIRCLHNDFLYFGFLSQIHFREFIHFGCSFVAKIIFLNGGPSVFDGPSP